jgi:hypothetical protein
MERNRANFIMMLRLRVRPLNLLGNLGVGSRCLSSTANKSKLEGLRLNSSGSGDTGVLPITAAQNSSSDNILGVALFWVQALQQ